MVYSRFIVVLAVAVLLAAPVASQAASREKPSIFSRLKAQVVEKARREKPVNPQAALRQRGQEQRLVRVHGIVRGMTNKLANLSDRLEKQLSSTERRLLVLENAGHELTVDAEFSALAGAIEKAQSEIAALADTLSGMSDIERPNEAMQQVKAQLRTLRETLQEVRTAFAALQKAVNEDLGKDTE